jgi:hypothetical protein
LNSGKSCAFNKLAAEIIPGTFPVAAAAATAAP